MAGRGAGTAGSTFGGRLRALAILAVACGGCAAATPPPSPAESVTAAPAPRSTEQGLYSSAQADRGQRVFGSICAACHGTAEFTGPLFELTWMAEPLANFYQHISTAMPQDRPGSLTPDEYASVVAYVLRLNGRPAGDRDLPADASQLAGVGWGE